MLLFQGSVEAFLDLEHVLAFSTATMVGNIHMQIHVFQALCMMIGGPAKEQFEDMLTTT